MKRDKKQPLKVVVANGKLTISIGVDVLAFAAQAHYDEIAFQDSEGKRDRADFRIAYATAFANSVRVALEDEDEAGNTYVHGLLDDAFQWLVEQSAPNGIVEQPPVRRDV